MVRPLPTRPAPAEGPQSARRRRARRAAQSRADDLRLFVEVLQTFCDDPRDAAAARLGEARAKQELAEAQRQLSAAGALSVEVRGGAPGARCRGAAGRAAAAAASRTRPGRLFLARAAANVMAHLLEHASFT